MKKTAAKSSWRSKEVRLAWILLLPMLIILFGFLAYPFVRSIDFSFYRALIGFKRKFVGIQNYIDVFNSFEFRVAFANTIIYSFSAVALKLLFGLIMALTLNTKIPMRNFFRGLLFLPWITPAIVTVLTWKWMFDSGSGLVNFLLLNLHIIDKPIFWLGSRGTAMFTAILANVWIGIPFFGISILASLQTAPTELYEVAELDGANAVQRFIAITFPWISGVVIITTILSLIWTFNDFLTIAVMTGGGPFDLTNVLATLTYQTAFVTGDLGKASAISIYSFPLLILFIVLLTPHIMREED